MTAFDVWSRRGNSLTPPRRSVFCLVDLHLPAHRSWRTIIHRDKDVVTQEIFSQSLIVITGRMLTVP